ncbi:hypothetical protein RJ639_001002 [Escallonia herrerae]|uniref:CMP/dCMP-type deaminase domain-containing protein n=1 Tax=Escallonia herrerae TaxID=1293975 RepID=A0AA88XB22_9ASTE|nr:hypothetical protein RJ639_001002 [Escallonia herrerae]
MVDWKCSEEHFEIVHIPDKPRIPPHLQPTVDVYASFIDSEHAHTLIRKLNQIVPLENLRHVKRVRRNRLEGGLLLNLAQSVAIEQQIELLYANYTGHSETIGAEREQEYAQKHRSFGFLRKQQMTHMMVDWKCSEEHFEIVHIPDKPRIPPHLQPTGKIQLSAILCLACGNDCHLDGIPTAVLELITMYQLSTFITKVGHPFILQNPVLVKPMGNWDRSIVRLRNYHGFARKVCKYAASSREEWQEQCKLWPTSYRPPTYNIDGITGFSDEDSRSVLTFMKSAIDLAKSGDREVVNAAIIVDPSTNQVIASAVDQMLSWNTPINKIGVETSCIEKPKATSFHSITNGVEDHGNLLLNCSLNGPKRMYSSVSCLHPWRWTNLQSCTSSSPWHPLRHAAIVAIELSAARDLRLFPRSGNTGDKFDQADCMECPFTSSSPLKRQKTNAAIADEDVKLNCQNGCHPDSGRPYLCTGFDIYLVWEPCTMCAMALVHQRVKRIFYAFPNSFAGALGSVHRLQGEKSLNHHYAVFRVVLPEEVLGDG